MIIQTFTWIGQLSLNICGSVGTFILFCVQFLKTLTSTQLRIRKVLVQLDSIGVNSLMITLITGTFSGAVLAVQTFKGFQQFGGEELLGPVVALSMAREIGPILTGLMVTARAGSAITAEIGLMKATEQLSAMEVMAVSPVARIIAPRFWAGMISMPILATIFSMVGILGGYFIAVLVIGVDEGAFWSQMQANVDFSNDIVDGAIKSIVFGFACTIIALFEGFDAPPTAEGVSRATTRTVVISSLAVLGLDFILTSFMFV